MSVPDILGQLAKIRQDFQAVDHLHVRGDSSTKVGLPICQLCQPLQFGLLLPARRFGNFDVKVFGLAVQFLPLGPALGQIKQCRRP